jgi:uncharacterized membrane protein YqaE (UPF0057 family)
MLYLLAILLPPVAMLLTGRPFQALLCFVLQITILGWIPAAIWAALVVNEHKADKRAERIAKSLRRE